MEARVQAAAASGVLAPAGRATGCVRRELGTELLWLGGVLVVYAGLSVLLLGRQAITDMSHTCACIGRGDPPVYMWALRWWPYAIGHGLNPFYTHLAWSPTGVNVAATALIPLPSVLVWPLTAAFGPVASYNVMALLAPALAGATAYLLCLELGGRRLPAIAGGWLFGFSSYELSQVIGHANLMLTALLPLLVLIVLWRLRGRLGRAAFIALEAVLLAAQLLSSTELLATACGFGAFVLVLAWVLLPERRGDLQRVTIELVGAGVIAALVCSPYIDWAVIRQRPQAPAGAADDAVTDLVSLVVPMTVTWIRYAQGLEAKFTANFAEQGGYLGVPLLIALVLAVWRLRRRRAVWIAVAVAVAALILSMGNALQVAGHRTIWLPWRLVSGARLFDAVMPDRMIVYVWLAASVLVALWLARPGRWQWARWALVLVAAVALLPDGSSGAYRGPPDQPPLVTTDAYKRVLPDGGNVLVLPFAAAGPAMMWQADANFWFRMPEGYLPTVVPAAVIANPAADAMGADPNPPIPSATLRRFLSGYDVRTVLVDPPLAGTWPQQLAGDRAARADDRRRARVPGALIGRASRRADTGRAGDARDAAKAMRATPLR